MTRILITFGTILGGALACLVVPSGSLGAKTYLPNDAMIRSDSAAEPTYADLVDLALAAELVARAQVRSVVRLKPEPGQPARAAMPSGAAVRLLIKARTSALLTGPGLPESVQFLADVPLTANGKPPKLAKTQVIIMARPVPGKPGTVQLAAPDAMLTWTAERENRIRSILTELNTPGAPPAIAALREALHVRGNLAGEGETQVFLSSTGGDPVTLSILRRPGQPTAWGVSFTDIVDQAAKPPQRDTLAWFRLACALPRELPKGANISGSAADRLVAAEDFALVLADLGPCTRRRAANLR
ncbi:hypothetical protein [Novosphingobium sp. Chol11]|uniref:hypothetical protein n=1 Tax=Novosphingobium sp. Chol11 TaxID=1385763 RepID=UPI0025D180E7|nr:hypothetical protein [Novosphingobium sp. Chol11]